MDKQLAAMRHGLMSYVPPTVLALCNGCDLEEAVCLACSLSCVADTSMPQVLALWNGCDLEEAAAGAPSIALDKLQAEAQVSLSFVCVCVYVCVRNVYVCV